MNKMEMTMTDIKVCFCGAPYPCPYHPPGECKAPKVEKPKIETKPKAKAGKEKKDKPKKEGG